jgi:sugar phosphate isomerase/epimerase
VYPAEILPNAQALAGVVDDIELVLFESQAFSNSPAPAVIERLAALAAAHDLTFTVHFPIDRQLGHSAASERQAMLSQIRRVLALTAPLDPYAYILHLEGIDAQADAARVAQWQQAVLPSLADIVPLLREPQRIALENLDYPFEWCQPFLAAFPFGVCLDAGHLWLRGDDWQACLARYRERTRVVHLYGVDYADTRHYALDRMPSALIKDFLAALGGFRGVLTLETFGYAETRSSIERLAACLGRRTKKVN